MISLFLFACSGNDDTKKDGTTDANNTDASTAETDNTRNSMQQDTLSQMNNQAIAAPDFVMKAATCGMMEVALAKVAQQKAKNQRLKNFGKMLVSGSYKSHQ